MAPELVEVVPELVEVVPELVEGRTVAMTRCGASMGSAFASGEVAPELVEGRTEPET